MLVHHWVLTRCSMDDRSSAMLLRAECTPTAMKKKKHEARKRERELIFFCRIRTAKKVLLFSMLSNMFMTRIWTWYDYYLIWNVYTQWERMNEFTREHVSEHIPWILSLILTTFISEYMPIITIIIRHFRIIKWMYKQRRDRSWILCTSNRSRIHEPIVLLFDVHFCIRSWICVYINLIVNKHLLDYTYKSTNSINNEQNELPPWVMCSRVLCWCLYVNAAHI